MNGAEIIGSLRTFLAQNPPEGLDARFVTRFFDSNLAMLVSIAEQAIAESAPPTEERLDAENRGRWAGHDENTIERWAEDTTNLGWLLSRTLTFRPDLASTVERTAKKNGLVLADIVEASRQVYRPVPAVTDGWLVVYEADQQLEQELPGVIARENFGQFAKAAYWNDELGADALYELSTTWFGRKVAPPSVPVDLSAHGDRLEELVTQTRLEGHVGAEEAERRLTARLLLLDAAGVVAEARRVSLPKPDPNLALSAVQLEEAFANVPTTPTARTTANLEAIKAVLAPPTMGDARTMLRYTGWGGLSLEGVRDVLPANLAPDEKALIHEYYTPPDVALALSRFVANYRAGLPRGPSGEVLGIEPSAGIGRLVNAFSGPGWESIQWTCLEYSGLSAGLLRRARPDLTILQTTFESWWVTTAGRLEGRLGLVLCNPPFGQRGAEIAIDPDPDLRERKAYVYFVRRLVPMLAAGGLALFIIPYGFMSGGGREFARLREEVLKQAHLIAAWRLPSAIYPGAGIVTDAIVLEGRGGVLSEVLAEDQSIATGNYFVENPHHVLGVERGTAGTEDAYRYEVVGDFGGLPENSTVRKRCLTCVVEPRRAEVPRQTRLEREQDAALPELIAHAAALGRRVSKYLDLLLGGIATQAQARAHRVELREDLLAWAAANSFASLADYKAVVGIPALLAAFQSDGSLVPTIAESQAVTQRYTGSGSTLDTAIWLHRERGPFTEAALREFRSSLGFETARDVTAELTAGEFALDWTSPPVWMPATDYYTGLVGERYQRCLERINDPLAAAQIVRLRGLIRFPTLQEIAPSPRLSWMPEELVREWASSVLEETLPVLERRDNLLSFTGLPFANLKQRIGTKNPKAILFGWLNYDLDLFQPPYVQRVSEDGEEESSDQALERARVEYGNLKVAHFRAWLQESRDRVNLVERRYTLGAFVMPEFPQGPLEIARWGNQITLKPHQNGVVRRLVHFGGGLNAFDTGVGKTFSGIATLAMQRQLGVCRRPVIVVPNTLIWKWHRDVLRCCPSYRVLVVGSKRRLNRSGVWVSEPDTAEERTQKWRRFQSGQYDVAIVPYSFFGSMGLRENAWREFLLATPLLARKLQLDARDLEEVVTRAADRERTGKEPPVPSVGDRRAADWVGEEVWDLASPDEREAIRARVQKEIQTQNLEREKQLLALTAKLGSLTERNRALFDEALRNEAAKLAEDTVDNEITFEEIGVDLLLVDEAQNFKNIWPMGALDGGTPKYLGAIQAGSARGIQLAAYRHNISRRIGAVGGTYLLSATPAKNSPIEYFTLIGLVNERAWIDVGVPTVEAFVDRYLTVERRDVVQPDMSIKEQAVVAGFQNLIELRDVIFRFAEFKTAADVGLVLPESKSETVLVDMSGEQAAIYYQLATVYRETIKSLGHAEGAKAAKLKNAALSLLTRMQLATIHPSLAIGLETPAHLAFESLPYSHPDTPQEERERRLMLLTMAKVVVGSPAANEANYRKLLEEGGQDLLDRWRTVSYSLHEAAKRKYAAKKKLKSNFSYATAVKAANFHAPKLDKCVELVLKYLRCGQIIFCDNVAVHRWLVELLVLAGIPRERIAVINGEVAKDALKRLEISDKFNGVPAVIAPDGSIEVEEIPPAFDIVIANQAAYEGIDLHRRTCYVYHLDLPWEPSTLRQRNGRAVRQGNLESNVHIIFLMARRSLDVVRYEYILGKLRWMSDLIESTDNSLSNPAADGEVDSESLVLFMSQDEEEAKDAIRVLKEEQERKRMRAIENRAWRDFEALLQRKDDLRALAAHGADVDVERKTILDADVAKLSASLAAIPSWPYAWLLRLDRPIALAVDSQQRAVPIIQDWTLQGRVEFGRVSTSGFGYRMVGTADWRSLARYFLPDSDSKLLQELLSLGYAPEDRGPTPVQPEEDLQGQILVKLEHVANTGTFEVLGLQWCSALWRTRLSSRFWGLFVSAVKRARLDFSVPIREGESWQLVPSTDPRVTEATLATLERGQYTAFYQYASATPTDWSFTDVALTTEKWWGIRFPKSRLRPDTVTYDNPRRQRRIRAKVLASSGPYLAIVGDEEVFHLIHVPSHAILRTWDTLDTAKQAADKIEPLQNWEWDEAPFKMSRGVKELLGGTDGEEDKSID